MHKYQFTGVIFEDWLPWSFQGISYGELHVSFACGLSLHVILNKVLAFIGLFYITRFVFRLQCHLGSF